MSAPPPVSPARAGLTWHCPACGTGPLYRGLLTLAPVCTHCGVDLAALEQGDGPAVFVILILGFIITGGALFVELRFEPSVWVHVVTWPPLIVVGALLMLRSLKGMLCAIHYVHRQGHVER